MSMHNKEVDAHEIDWARGVVSSLEMWNDIAEHLNGIEVAAILRLANLGDKADREILDIWLESDEDAGVTEVSKVRHYFEISTGRTVASVRVSGGE